MVLRDTCSAFTIIDKKEALLIDPTIRYELKNAKLKGDPGTVSNITLVFRAEVREVSLGYIGDEQFRR